MQWVVRVYALIEGTSESPHAPGAVPPTWLVLEEYFQGGWIQKFPGGGVEPHEGLLEALTRELQEELQTPPRSAEHFYTTDFYQRSYYHRAARLLAVYYRVRLADEPRPSSPRFRLRWLRADYFQLTFPVDRYVGQLLQRQVQPGVAEPLHTEPSSRGH